MTQIVVTSAEELKAIIRDVLSERTEPTTGVEPDNITLNRVVELLNGLGFPTSKAKIYKLTSTGSIPCRKYGSKLIFSRKELLQWAQGNTKQVGNLSSIASAIASSANRKNRNYGK